MVRSKNKRVLVASGSFATQFPKKTQKKIICGTFNGLIIGKLPIPTTALPDGSTRQLIPGGTDMGSPAAYISITDVVEGTELVFQFVNQSKNKVMFRSGVKLDIKDRLATVEIVAPLPPMSAIVKEPGVYSFDVLCDAEIDGCHILAEVYHQTGTPHPGFSPSDLYAKIGSSHEDAYRASLKLA